ncbi:MAG: nucleotide sugar dehydrogenase [Dehalococcoidia bacterium]
MRSPIAQALATSLEDVDRRIASGEAQVCVIGLGTVGLPQLLVAAKAGFPAVGIDVDASLVERINGGISSEADTDRERLRQALTSGRLRATTDFDAVCDSDCVILCVPTSWYANAGPDLSAVTSAVQEVARRLRSPKLIVLESTVPPGSTRQVVLPLLETGRLEVGSDFCLAFAPERFDPGNKRFSILDIPKVVGGITPTCTALAARFYSKVGVEVHPVSSPEVAEITKVFENTFRFVNIGLANELALLCNSLGISPREVLDAASTKPFGFMPHSPSPGVGGRCIPLASRYFLWTAQRQRVPAKITDAAIAVNGQKPELVAKETLARVREAVTGRAQPLVLIVGIAYKPGVGDVRSSVALTVASLLKHAGVRLQYHDPLVPTVAINGERLTSLPLTEDSIRSADCTLILCPHPGIDYGAIRRHSRCIVDPTNTVS